MASWLVQIEFATKTKKQKQKPQSKNQTTNNIVRAGSQAGGTKPPAGGFVADFGGPARGGSFLFFSSSQY